MLLKARLASSVETSCEPATQRPQQPRLLTYTIRPPPCKLQHCTSFIDFPISYPNTTDTLSIDHPTFFSSTGRTHENPLMLSWRATTLLSNATLSLAQRLAHMQSQSTKQNDDINRRVTVSVAYGSTCAQSTASQPQADCHGWQSKYLIACQQINGSCGADRRRRSTVSEELLSVKLQRTIL